MRRNGRDAPIPDLPVLTPEPGTGEVDTVGTAATAERIDHHGVIFAASWPGGRYRRRHAEIGKLAAIAAKYGVTIEPPTPERWSAC